MLERTSITLRLSLLFALTWTVALSGIGAYLYWSLDSHFTYRDTNDLIRKAERVRQILMEINASEDILSQQARLADAMVGRAPLYLTLLNPRGTVLFASAPFRLPDRQLRDAFPASATPDSTQLWHAGRGRWYRTLAAWAKLGDGPRQVLIALALDVSENQDFLSMYRHNLILAIVIGGALSALTGYVVTKRGVRPVREMAHTASMISAKHLSERLEVDRAPAELKPLASAFNTMLARLEDSFLRLADFSSDLTHELRTPINNLMGQTQVALTRTRSAEEYRRVLESNLEEYERLARMISDMLFLAKADHAQVTLRTESVDLRVELDKLAEFYEAHAQELGVRVVCAGEGHVAADRLLVQRAVSNLLSNAIRHTPAGGEVKLLTAHDDSGAVTVSVSNPGYGIPREHLDRIFDRFYRIDSARGSSHEGAGLGLAIVRSIMALHGGRVSVESAPHGVTTFALHFPAALSGGGTSRAKPPGAAQPREAFGRKGLTA